MYVYDDSAGEEILAVGLYVDNLTIVHSAPLQPNGDPVDQNSFYATLIGRLQHDWEVEDEGRLDDMLGVERSTVTMTVPSLCTNQSTSTSSFAASCQNRHLVSMLTKFCLTPAHCRRSLMQSATIRIGIQPTRRIPNS